MKKGISLLETIVVVSIIATLSLVGINKIDSFRKETSIDNVASELVADIKMARNKSITGEILGNESESSFSSCNSPDYGISISEENYKMIRKYTQFVEGSCNTLVEEDLETINLNGEYLLSPSGKFYFERNTGYSPNLTIEVITKDGELSRKISISRDFQISVINN